MSKRLALRPSPRKGECGCAQTPVNEELLSFQIDTHLKEWAQGYASRHHTSLAQLIKDYLVTLKKREEGDGVEQI